jgi:hypothetical protein
VHLVEPRLHSHEGIGSQTVHPTPGVVGEHLHVHEPAVAKDAQVSAEGRPGHLYLLGQLAAPAGGGPKQFYDPPARRIGERRECGGKVIYDIINY